MIDWLANKLRLTNDEVTEISAIAFINWTLFYQDKEKRESK